MRLAFMGTPEFAVPTLEALIAAGHEVAAVYTQPPRPGGRRGRELSPSPVQRRAEAAGFEVRTPATLRDDEEQERFRALALDAAVVAAYGLILPVPVLEAPRWGCLNVHASLLPRWRGAAPIQRAILAGDKRTGVCIMRMEQGLDTGPIYSWATTGIGTKSAGDLTAELAALGAGMMAQAIDLLGSITPRAQSAAGVTYAHKIDKSEARLDFTAPAATIDRQIRAFSPVPGAYFELEGERIKILRARISDLNGEPGTVLDHRLTIACGDRSLTPTRIQRAGRAPMRTDEVLRGFPIPPGTRLA